MEKSMWILIDDATMFLIGGWSRVFFLVSLRLLFEALFSDFTLFTPTYQTQLITVNIIIIIIITTTALN